MGLRNLNVPNLCGASAEFNELLNKCQDIKAKFLSQIEADASALASELESGLQACETALSGLTLPQLPIPSTSLQSELTSLITKTVGSPEYNSMLASITAKFGEGLTAMGKSLDSLVSDALGTLTSGGDMCDVIPNFKADADGNVIEEAKEVLQASTDTVTEVISEVKDNEELKANMTALAAKMKEDAEKFAAVVKAEQEKLAELGIKFPTFDPNTGTVDGDRFQGDNLDETLEA